MVCMAANAQETLNMLIQMDCRKLLDSHGGAFDRIFRIQAEDLIEWAAERSFRGFNSWSYGSDKVVLDKLLREQFINNREVYLAYQKKATFDASSRMMSIIKELDEKLYQDMLGSGAGEQKEKVPYEELLPTLLKRIDAM